MKPGTCTALVNCNKAPVADVLVEGLAVSLCPAHLFERACEAVGWDVDVDDGRDLVTIADELLDASMSRGTEAWAGAHALVVAAVSACQAGQPEEATDLLRGADALAGMSGTP